MLASKLLIFLSSSTMLVWFYIMPDSSELTYFASISISSNFYSIVLLKDSCSFTRSWRTPIRPCIALLSHGPPEFYPVTYTVLWRRLMLYSFRQLPREEGEVKFYDDLVVKDGLDCETSLRPEVLPGFLVRISSNQLFSRRSKAWVLASAVVIRVNFLIWLFIYLIRERHQSYLNT